MYYQLSDEDSTYLEPTYVAVDTLLARTTAEDDDYGDVLSLSGRVMMRRGERDQAIEIFEKLMLDDPANFEVVERVGDGFSRTRDWENAALFLEMAADGRMRTDSESFDLYYNLGVIFYNLKNYMKSIEAYQNALRLEEDNREASYSLLVTYYQAEFYDEAVMLGQQYTTTVAPEDSRGWQILSLSYNKKGMKIKAEEAFQKYKELTGE